MVDAGRCERHPYSKGDDRRGSASRRGYGSRWRRYRASYLSRHPLCVECGRHGRVMAASVVDHISPHRGDPAKMWNPNNHQALCKPCHDRKTATQDGGFGR